MRRVKGFDGLRAISALLVFYEHKVQDNAIGSAGVWIFYCLSGYLIIGILHNSRKKVEADGRPRARTRALVDFWRNRALRILPVYYVTICVVLAWRHIGAGEFLSYATYTQNFYIAFVSHSWGAMTHLWSLAIEQQFYLLAAPALLLTAASGHKRLISGVFWLCFGYLVCAAIFHWDTLVVSQMPPSNFAFMAVGGYLFLADECSPILAFLARPAVLAATSLGLLGSYVTYWLSSVHDYSTPMRLYFGALPFTGSIISYTIRNAEGRLVAFLETRVLKWLGKISYGFYVYHYLTPSAHAATRVFHVSMDSLPARGLWIVVQLGVSLAVSHLSWVYLESRFLALKHRAPRVITAVPGGSNP